MHPIARTMRLMTHVNIGATLALLAWLASSHLPAQPAVGEVRATEAVVQLSPAQAQSLPQDEQAEAPK